MWDDGKAAWGTAAAATIAVGAVLIPIGGWVAVRWATTKAAEKVEEQSAEKVEEASIAPEAVDDPPIETMSSSVPHSVSSSVGGFLHVLGVVTSCCVLVLTGSG